MNFSNQSASLPDFLGNFRFMQAEALAAIKNMYSLDMGPAELEICRRHYERVEKRDPVISELRLLDELIKKSKRTPDAFRIFDVKSDDLEIGRTYNDLISKLGALEKAAPSSYSDIASAADLYIKRVGNLFYAYVLVGKMLGAV